MADDTLKLPLLARDLGGVAIEIRVDGKLTELSFAASSEAPVERLWGDEVLSHAEGAIRMGRVKRGAVPLLFNHDWDDPIGIVDRARVEASRLLVDAHLFATARAAEVGQMIDGGLRNVSLGYRLHVVEEDNKTHRITAIDWEPFEVSIVSIPADPTVGIGRAMPGGEELEVRMVRASPAAGSAEPHKEPKMAAGQVHDAAAGATAEPKPEPRLEARDNQALLLEQQRIRGIENLCKANKIDQPTRDHWIGSGLPIDEVTEDLLKIVAERSAKIKPATYLGLSPAEQDRFSLFRAVIAAEARDWSKAPFELECVREVAKRLDKVPDPKSFHVPFEILQRSIPVPRSLLQRDMTVSVGAQGGFLVETENVGFIEMLRNRSVAYSMGARRLSGLVGNITIPRQSGAGTAGWLASEAATITESNQTLQQVALSPKTVGAYTEVSRQLMLQSNPSAEGIVTADLATVTALAVDAGILNGSGASGQPTGIINTAGVGSVVGTALAFDDIVEFQSDVAGANVMPMAGGYATTPSVASLCIQRVKYPSTASPLWEGSVWNGMVQGFPAMSSLQIPAAVMLFGDWAQVIVGEWGNLEITVNPFANFQGLLIGIRAVVTIDVALRYAGAFSIATAIT